MLWNEKHHIFLESRPDKRHVPVVVFNTRAKYVYSQYFLYDLGKCNSIVFSLASESKLTLAFYTCRRLRNIQK